ncbi:NDP-hexose 2,3-dehydratase family protein [Actinoplanes siamensis]|uniref:NDP-hexose 2,3-dehydratase n=1 Tax=Actinoplanes siamensis TaxID=1223317 RepID=A0A919NA73_9ACTN|nr:NDP-hexose 2,3-dehydratase family protein [Actinoplanes siamensis]GIF07049.1 NDP-hexose 2,3-dehydratase [Actinoplanes siamensis]
MRAHSTVAPSLVPRTDPHAARRILESLTARPALAADVPDWLADHARRHTFRVERVPFEALDHWHFDAVTGNLRHRSGRFFTVEGLHVEAEGPPVAAPRTWRQPIIVQPEVGILGILAKEFDGVLHFLMQAKMEPGNPNLVQLSPTVQATRSNYSRVHAGAGVRYLEYFRSPGHNTVMVDVLQSEQGAWFYRKVNRNMIVETRDDVPLHEDFRWLTLAEIGALLRRDLVVNMDARTVLACAPLAGDESAALHRDADLMSWFVAERSGHRLVARLIPLADTTDWTRDDTTIRHVPDRHFQVVAVRVEAGSREAPRWTQPLLEPLDRGVVAFVMRRFSGVPHLLVTVRVEAGFLNTVELGPTVQCVPRDADGSGVLRSPFLDLVLHAPADRIRYSATHSEEGGRFLNAENRYLIVEADATEAPARPPAHHFWVTPGQLRSLVRHGNYVNMQARSLLAAINSGAVDLQN